MPTSADFERERSELNSLLSSGIFNRAPNLEHLLVYICSKYFDGHTEGVKEYNIAIEALGRSPDFDQKKDSIVRVEAHRLRRRLTEYYAGDGADHPVHIIVPQGQYAPRFILREPPVEPLVASPATLAEPAAAAEPLPPPEPPPAVVIAKPRSVWWRPIAALIFLAVAVGAVSSYSWYSGKARKDVALAKTDLPVLARGTEDVRILAGLLDRNYTDTFGRTWLADRYYRGGTVFRVTNHPIIGAFDPLVYQSRRQGSFGYDIPLKQGVYELRLHFAETLYGYMNLAGGGETSRVFSVIVNGKPLLQYFDVIADAGASTADVKVFTDITPADDGKLHLDFKETTNEPFLNAIEIVPGIPGQARPIYVVARDRGYTDKQGQFWEPDHYARGGLLVTRTEEILGAADPELHRGERFGNLSYSIPVAQGRYGVTLHFAEAWFGSGKPAGGGVGSRVFDILANGVLLLRNFDIFKEAGGSDRPLVRTFHGLEANHQGKLIISLTPVTNYACINALEIVDESK